MVIRNEGSTCIVVMRDDVAPSGSKAISRMKGWYRNLGGPAVADGFTSSGVYGEGQPEPYAIDCRKSDRFILSLKSSKETR